MDVSAMTTRVDRVEELVKRELANIFLSKVKDPRLQSCVVSRVKMSNDLRVAWVWLSVYEADERAIREALGRANGYLRREISARLDLRHSPELRFEMDRGPKQLIEMSELLRTLDMSPAEEEAGES